MEQCESCHSYNTSLLNGEDDSDDGNPAFWLCADCGATFAVDGYDERGNRFARIISGQPGGDPYKSYNSKDDEGFNWEYGDAPDLYP